MSLGISAGGWAAIGGAAMGALGSKKSGGGSSSTTQQVDPRLAHYLYGEDDKGGLLKDVDLWYQANKSGLNDQMAQGLNTQWNVYNDPRTLGGYQQMASLGSGLMGAPVMGNPFSDGRVSLRGSANLGMGSPGGQGAQQPAQGQQQAPQFPSFQMPQPATGTPAPAPGPFTSAMPAYQTVAPPPAPAPQSSGWESLFDGSKQPVLSSDLNKKPFQQGTNWQWNGTMWQPERLEQGGP
ncbi:MAG: hypothetical protein DI587_22225 [Variovorax paradoxus]|nr:MAG: hypothetical protein DI583_22225 [Variovorax paradoxus]PZQ06390.1 MAG: hypothetical protein DI587_22225 [Variovorax paradoxus]